MGVVPGHRGENFDISTFSRLSADADNATLTSLSIKNNQVDVTHKGTSSTILKNNSGPMLRWRAQFPGTLAYLSIGSKKIAANHSITPEGLAISWTDIAVSPCVAVVVSK